MDTVAGDRVSSDPNVLSGVPVFRGTRIPVNVVLDYLADGYSVEGVPQDYPDLTRDDVRSGLLWASALISSPPTR